MEESPELELVERLHSAVRRYCQEQDAHWSDLYTKLDARGAVRLNVRGGGWVYSEAARGIFPRYNVLAAMLAALEGVVPAELGDLGEAKRRLVAIAARAHSPLNNTGDIEENAIDEERDRFEAFVAALDEATLWEVRLLPYRRTLSKDEIVLYWEGLERRWGVQGHWIPLAKNEAQIPVLVVDAEAFGAAVKPGAFRKAVRALGVERVVELRELDLDPSCILDVSLLTPSYHGSEGFWFPESIGFRSLPGTGVARSEPPRVPALAIGFRSLPGTGVARSEPPRVPALASDWLLYASHESSLTAAGEPMIRLIEELWPKCGLHPPKWG